MSKDLALNHNEQRFSLTGLNLELDNFINWDKSNIKHAAKMATNSVQDGECDPVDALVFIKKGSELFKELDAQIRPIAESKSVGSDYVRFGVKVDNSETGVSYDYNSCNDPIYQELNEKFEVAKSELEDRKTFLKSVTKPMDIVVNEAEVYKIQPPIRSGKAGLKLTIK